MAARRARLADRVASSIASSFTIVCLPSSPTKASTGSKDQPSARLGASTTTLTIQESEAGSIAADAIATVGFRGAGGGASPRSRNLRCLVIASGPLGFLGGGALKISSSSLKIDFLMSSRFLMKGIL